MAALNKAEKIFKIFYSKGGHLERNDVMLACGFLNGHGVIALPTDTLYGIAAKADDSLALERVYKIKGRDLNKPLAVCLPSLDQIDQVADVCKTNRLVLSALLPGPITIVLKRSASLNRDLNPNIDSIGVRIPDHNFPRAICADLGCPLALTSANKSGQSSPLNIRDFQNIWDELDAVFDQGPLKGSLPEYDSQISQRMREGSTVIDLTEEKIYKIIREGCGLNRTVSILSRFGFKRKT